jgi:hypothetical protein
MEVWVPLLSALVGGLIAVVPVLITLRYQAEELRWDRQEQRREAKTLLALELLRNDVKAFDDAIDNDLRALDLYANIRLKKEAGKITEVEMRKQMKDVAVDENGRVYLLAESSANSEKMAISFGDEFYKEFNKYSDATTAYMQFYVNSPTFTMEEVKRIDLDVLKSAAMLHNMLKEKLISIRDS